MSATGRIVGPEADPRVPSPGFFVALLVAAIFAVEVGVMAFLLPLSSSWPRWVSVLLDAFTLVSLLLPVLYILVFRPLFRSLKEREEANRRLREGIAGQERLNREMSDLSQMVNLFHACRTEVEARAVITRHVALLFPGSGGTLFAFNASRNLVEAVATWGGGSPSEGFAADDCWSLRLGRAHLTEEGSCTGCHHVSSTAAALCVPMVAQGETLGVLQLAAPAAGAFDETGIRLAQATAESVALGLSNLRLRDALRHLAIRDPLTSLFNRRYLEETIERELLRAARAGASVGVIALDIDHFKRFNDTFGHEAGDVLIKELGQLLRQHVRGADIPCRQGGEEFTLVLPEANLEVTRARAEEIRSAARALNVPYRGQVLGTISVSLGVAAFPEHGATPEALLRAADAALYRAKAGGRDRVVLASAGMP